MADSAEQAFIKTFLNTLSTQPVTFADDYQQPSEKSLKRVPVLPVDLPPPPKRKLEADVSTSSSASISILFKSLKPLASFTIPVQPTDTILSIKSQLASQPCAPPADAQRLLLKGKALADGKLLKEYNVKDGDTVNLVVKPGYNWDPSKSTPAVVSSPLPSMTEPTPPSPVSPMSVDSKRPSLAVDPNFESQPHEKKHQRIPSVVLSPSPRSESPRLMEKDIVLTLDPSAVEESFPTQPPSTYHTTVANPAFWDRLHTFLRSEFSSDTDTLQAFEDFLRASKGTLTASEIAKIRDQIGVVGMSGT